MDDKPVKAVIYCRVSTEDQTTQNQLEALTAWAQHRGFTIVETYQETESAWKSGHQRELNRLLGAAYQRRFDTILVWSLDRISREGALAILEFVNKLRKWGIRVLSYQEQWTEAPGELGELLFALTGWVARMESQRRSERTKAGLARKAATGFKLGRPPGSRDKGQRRRRKKDLF